MGTRLYRHSFPLATVLLAALACLQPGIDPVFLTILSAAHPVRPADHGWVVGATQAGMAAGSLLAWRLGARLPRDIFPLAALCALLTSIATVWLEPTAMLLGIRASYGLAMGVLYTHAMSRAAAGRPNGAYGAVFLVQLILSTLIALLLPAIAETTDAQTALAALTLAPLAALALILGMREGRPQAVDTPLLLPSEEERHPIDAPAWALAVATLLFICATMMVWSFTGALAIAAKISEDVVGQAVAIGSLVGAITAACVMREKPLVPLPVTGLFAGLCLVSPIGATRAADPLLFVLSVILLNIGSTAIIIRGSGMATARSRDSLFRRLVTCTHSGGMIIGPVIGSLATVALGDAGLLTGAVAAIAGGCIALLYATVLEWPAPARPVEPPQPADSVFAIIQ